MADTIIIDVKVSNAEAVKEIEQSTAAIKALKAQEEELRDERQKGNVTTEKYYKALTDIREETERHKQNIQAYNKALKENIKTEKEESDSLNKMRKDLRLLLKEYDSLSKAERESAKGTELLNKIKGLTKEVSDAEQATGRFQRNVGNYGSALDGLTGKLDEYAKNSGFFSKGMSGIANGAKNVGQTLNVLAKNPFFIILRVVIGLITLFTSQIKKSDDAMTSLQKVTAAFKPVLDALRTVFEAIVNVVTKVALAFTNAIGKLGEWLGLSRESADANQDLVDSMDKLEERERQYTVNSAKRSAKISDAREKAGDKENYTAKQRIQFLNEAAEAEKAELKERQEIAKEKLRLAQQDAKLNKDTSDETKNNLANLEAAVYQAEQAYSEGMRSIVRQTNSAIKEIGQEEENAAKERREKAKQAAAAAKQRRSTELKERRAAEDLILSAMAEGLEKQAALLETQYDRQVEDLRTRLKTEEGLSKAARKSINEQIILLEAEKQIKLAQMEEESRRKFMEKRLEYEQKIAEQGLEAAKMAFDAETLAYQNALNERLQAAQDNAEEIAWIRQQEADKELSQARMRQSSILRINYDTEEAYKLAMEQANADVIAAQNNATAAAQATAAAIQAAKDKTTQSQQAIAASFNNMAGSLGDMFSTLAENDERYQDYATAMAGVQLLVSTAVSIANAIQGATKAAAETGVAAPFTMPTFIAEMIGIVLGSVAQATALLHQASNTPQYAQGGLISGPGTGTSDSITARVSNGESIMTAKATAMFYDQLSAMNVAGGGRPFSKSGGRNFAQGGVVSASTIMSGRQMQQLADVMAAAVENLHPVVSVREITSAQNRVKSKEIISRS